MTFLRPLESTPAPAKSRRILSYWLSNLVTSLWLSFCKPSAKMKHACVEVLRMRGTYCQFMGHFTVSTESWSLTSSLRVGHRLYSYTLAVVDTRPVFQLLVPPGEPVFICILAPSLCFLAITFDNSIFTKNAIFIITPVCTVAGKCHPVSGYCGHSFFVTLSFAIHQ